MSEPLSREQAIELTGAHDQLVEQLAAMDKAQQAREKGTETLKKGTK